METLLPFLTFIVVSTITPGPNNLLLATSGIKFGLARTLPHIAGIHAGLYGLVILCGVGLGQLVLAVPEAVLALKVFGTGYLAYLAWKIIGIKAGGSAGDAAEPMTLAEAAIFQFSNPKAWMMVTTGLNLSLGQGEPIWVGGLTLIVGFGTLGLCCNVLWVAMGQALQGAWQDHRYRIWINGTLAAMTIATIFMFWMY